MLIEFRTTYSTYAEIDCLPRNNDGTDFLFHKIDQKARMQKAEGKIDKNPNSDRHRRHCV